MKVSEVSKELLESINPVFEKHGFLLNKKNREFKRKVGDFVQTFDLFFYKKSNYISIKPEIRIKSVEIERVYKSNTSVEGRPYLTLGNHLFEILKYIDDGVEIDKGDYAVSDWLIEDNEDIKKLTNAIPVYLEETILPYFKQNSSIERVDKLLNKYPREISIHNSLYPLRANLAMIAAKLNKNPKYNELLDIYQEELEEAEITYKNDFKKLKNELDNITE